MNQFVIFVTGVSAAFITQSDVAAWQKWAPLIALVGQPYWLLTTWRARQWGMFSTSVAYTLVWMLGIYNYWLK